MAGKNHIFKQKILSQFNVNEEDLKRLCLKMGVKSLAVFGSVTQGGFKIGQSDIDFLVEFPKGYDLFNQRLPLQEALSVLTARNIDLLPEHEINKHLRDSILQEARYL